MKHIYIIYSQNYTVLSILIKLIAKEEYAHVSLSLDSTCTNMYSFGRKYYWNPFIGTFVSENINEGLFKVKKNSKIKVYKINITDNQYSNIIKLINKYKTSNIKYKYNFLGLIYTKLGIRKDRKNKMYCAEFVYNVLSDDSVNIIKKIKKPIELSDILSMNNYELYYEGRTRKFK